MTTPFNLALHDHLIALGFHHDRIPAYWADDGDAENGPDLSGCMTHDRYDGDGIAFVVFEDGMFDWDYELGPHE